MTAINFQVLGVGAWGPCFQNWSELSEILNGKQPENHEITGPKPEIIPANERRRAPLPVRLAVESSWQAVNSAELDAADLPCVFVSGIGDTQLTDYMCKILATDSKALSPTKFHNSVHNAAAGYWTISTGCLQAANSVAGFQESVPLTMMEALIQCAAEKRPLLITFYDAPCSEALKDLLENDAPFSLSIIIAPENTSETLPNYSAQIRQQHAPWPILDAPKALRHLYDVNPAARILPFLKSLVTDEVDVSNIIRMPTSQESSLEITLASNT